MKKRLLILALTLLGLTAYFVLAGSHYEDKSRRNLCTRVEVKIPDSTEYRFVTRDTVLAWLEVARLSPLRRPLHYVRTDAIESFLRARPYVSGVQVYADMSGVLTIELTQRHPQVRIMSESGFDFYLDSTLTTLTPSDKYAPAVPVVTGHLIGSDTLPQKIIQKNAHYFKILINFVNKIQSDETLAALVTQVYVTQTSDIELVPRIGVQVIMFGELDKTYPEKLEKLKKFYSKTFKNQWWAYAKIVDVKYNKQILLR